ncbi:hypothetical protein vBYenSP400_38 [Yersinia phage vB_YenS_P400]|nr:hypothetical protein vBYenSP400_38 [Yersinia phage vB_YenS_P400]
MHPIVRVAMALVGAYFAYHTYEMYLEEEWVMAVTFGLASLLGFYVAVVGDEGDSDDDAV